MVSPRLDAISRRPLVDFALSEIPFSKIDYKIFPDLQMYPAVAGAIVPVYFLPGKIYLSRRFDPLTNEFDFYIHR